MTKKVELESYTREFLYKEYDSITTAHFEAIKSISSFYKNYILIMTIPITIASIIAGSQNEFSFNRDLALFLSVAFYIIGLCLMIYISNLRCEALLYARTINGIRSYFNDESNKEIEKSSILPVDKHLPEYRESWEFMPVIITFFILNTMYPVAAFFLIFALKWTILAEIIFISSFIHILMYLSITSYWEKKKGESF